jgi:hypothetical protein
MKRWRHRLECRAIIHIIHPPGGLLIITCHRYRHHPGACRNARKV